MAKVVPLDSGEGVLGIVVPPVGDQLSLCTGCVDISLRLHPRESLFHPGVINLLSSMDYLHTIYLRDWIIRLFHLIYIIIPYILFASYATLRRHSLHLRVAFPFP